MTPTLRTLLWAVGIPVAVATLPVAVARVDLTIRREGFPASLVDAKERFATLARRDELARATAAAPARPGVHIIAADTLPITGRLVAELQTVADSLMTVIGPLRPGSRTIFAVIGTSLLAPEQPTLRAQRSGVQLPRRDGDPCVTLVGRSGWTDAGETPREADRRRAWAVARLTGSPCLLLARFGLPSPTIVRQLDQLRWGIAGRSEWWAASTARPPAGASGYEFAEVVAGIAGRGLLDDRRLVRCAERRPGACARELFASVDAVNESRASMFLFEFPQDRSAPEVGQLLGVGHGWLRRVPEIRPDGTTNRDAESGGRPPNRLISDIAHAVGPERFARLWQTDRPLDDAYSAVAGEPFDDFVARWLDAPTTPRRALRGAQMPWSDALWVLAIVAAVVASCAVLAARRQAT